MGSKRPRKVIYNNRKTWVNPATEAIRAKECLCLNCELLKKNAKDNCPIAQALSRICTAFDVALIITRCPHWHPKLDLHT